MKKIRLSLYSCLILLSTFIISCQREINQQEPLAPLTEQELNLEYCPISDKTPDKITIENASPDDQKFVDYNKPVKDFGTDFVVKEFFKKPDHLFNFMKIVYKSIADEIAKYRKQHDLDEQAIFFLFKGGNVLRMLFNEILATLPEATKNFLDEKYAQYFKRSDADFSVFVDESKIGDLNYEQVMKDMTNLVFQIFGNLRREFNKNPGHYFSFMELEKDEADQALNKYLSELQKIDALKDQENPNWYGAKIAQLQLLNAAGNDDLTCKYEGQFDYRFEFDAKDKNKIVGTPLSKRPNWLANTINYSLEWPSGIGHDIIKFYLVRMKGQAELTYLLPKKTDAEANDDPDKLTQTEQAPSLNDQNQPGEVIRKPIGMEFADVSFPHRLDFRLKKFFQNYAKWVTKFTLTNENTGDILQLQAESLDGLAADLHEVVFEQSIRPWDAAKYEKRINRLFFIFITEMMANYGIGSEESQKYVAFIDDNIIKPLATLNLQDPQAKDEVTKIEQSTLELEKSWAAMEKANHFFLTIVKKVSEELIPKPKDSDAQELKKLIDLINENLANMREISIMPASKIDISDIYNVKLKNFI